jgi:hypothetical protein
MECAALWLSEANKYCVLPLTDVGIVGIIVL